jgi:hypothetical protein
MVKVGSFNEENSTKRVKIMTFLLLDHESTLLMSDTLFKKAFKAFEMVF